jgi:ABC-2 type transport system ATP-binding protein
VLNQPMLEVRGVRKSYGDVRALQGVDMDISPGEVMGLLGPNGAGKSTLMSIVAGLIEPDAGSVRIGGIDVREDPLAARRPLGIAPQEIGVYLQLSVGRNLRFFGRLAGLRRAALASRIEEVAAALDLTALMDRPAHALSGGEKRRLHTAMAMLHRPALLLLDEPTAGVDVHTRGHLLDFIKRLAGEGTAICYATHYLHEVESLGASVAILEEGSIIAHGQVDELVAASGGSFVELVFEGPVPVQMRSMADIHDGVARIQAADAGFAITRALGSIGTAADRVRSVEIMQPSLESAYLSITGRRFEAGAKEEAG